MKDLACGLNSGTQRPFCLVSRYKVETIEFQMQELAIDVRCLAYQSNAIAVEELLEEKRKQEKGLLLLGGRADVERSYRSGEGDFVDTERLEP